MKPIGLLSHDIFMVSFMNISYIALHESLGWICFRSSCNYCKCFCHCSVSPSSSHKANRFDWSFEDIFSNISVLFSLTEYFSQPTQTMIQTMSFSGPAFKLCQRNNKQRTILTFMQLSIYPIAQHSLAILVVIQRLTVVSVLHTCVLFYDHNKDLIYWYMCY